MTSPRNSLCQKFLEFIHNNYGSYQLRDTYIFKSTVYTTCSFENFILSIAILQLYPAYQKSVYRIGQNELGEPEENYF